MRYINSREQANLFAQEVSRFMSTHGVGITLACCHLGTYPDDTEYCSGHGDYGNNRDSHDCKCKEYCKELAERGNKC